MSVVPISFDCVVCQARSHDFGEKGEETMVLLVMMARARLSLDDIRHDLCFMHRRHLDDCERAPDEAGHE